VSYYSGHDPISNCFDFGSLGVLGLAALVLTAVAVEGIRRRDLRA
jgi:hypothetical protein